MKPYEVMHPDGDPPHPQFDTWKEAFAAQATWNKELPGHKARKIPAREIPVEVECKASRSDFLADKGKRFRKNPAIGMGDWRFFMCPPCVIKPEDLPDGWGLLYAMPKQIKKVHGVPSNCHWWSKKPFEGDKRCETQMMYSALRRMVVRGHFDAICEKLA